MDEIWKDIEGYEGWYMVSNKGRVKSVKVNRHTHYPNTIERERIIRPFDNGNGYLMVGMCVNGMRKNSYVHRLVANAFLKKIPGKDFVNHIDYDKKNNNVENLEWCTAKENTIYSSLHMKKEHNAPVGISGQKYIGIKNGRHRVHIKRSNIYIEKCFSDMDSAIQFRDKALKEMKN